MHPFYDLCRRSLEDIKRQGRYRSFTPLAKQANRFPIYRMERDGVERDVVVWSSNDYLAMGNHPEVIAAARQLGALSRTKMLWITAKNDSVYSPDLARALHAAFVSSGGVADLVVTADDLPGDDPHALLFSETGAAVWQPLVEHFLAP